MMTRKLADALAVARPDRNRRAEYETWLAIRNEIAWACSQSNPRFDWAKFREATELDT